MRRIAGLAAVAALFAFLIGSGFVGPDVRAQETARKPLVAGWFRDRAVKYYDFGGNTPGGGNTVVTAPIYVFIHGLNVDGTPNLVKGQHNIVDVLPGQPGYSDLWRVHFVVVPASYTPDSVKSKVEIDAARFEVRPTDMLVNCPIVPAGTTLEGGEPLVQGWAKGQSVFYPDFGQNPARTAPIWVFIRGMKADGTPDFVQGQGNVIDTVPQEAGYSAFWRVNLVTVPADYVPNTIRSAAGVSASGFAIKETDMVVNCPVVTVAAQTAVALPRTGDGSSLASDGGGSAGLWYALIAGGVLAATVGGGAMLRKARARS